MFRMNIKPLKVTVREVVNLVGVGLCNNPVYELADEVEYLKDEVDNQGHNITLLMTNTVLRAQICSSDETQRSCFGSHVFVWVGNGFVFDACIGPCLGTMSINDYLRSVIDYSTENERRVSRYQIGVKLEDASPKFNYNLK